MTPRFSFSLLIISYIILLPISACGIVSAQIVGLVRHGDVLSFISTRGGYSDIYLLDITTGLLMQLTDNPMSEEWARWSPDGSRIAYTADDPEGGLHLYVMDSYGRNVRRLTHGDGINWYPTWSPDGTLLAGTSGAAIEVTDIRIFDAADGTLRQTLPSVGGEDRVTSWHNNQLLFSAGHGTLYEIYRINSDGSDLHQLTDNGYFNFNPVWSPDGQSIAFQSRAAGDFELYVMDADGSNLRQLTANNSSDSSPMWSRDGSSLVYISISESLDYELYVINADGTNSRRLTFNDFQDSSPAWMP